MKSKYNIIKFMITFLKNYREEWQKHFRLSFFYYYIVRNIILLVSWLINVQLAATMHERLLIQLFVFLIIFILVVFMSEKLLSVHYKIIEGLFFPVLFNKNLEKLNIIWLKIVGNTIINGARIAYFYPFLPSILCGSIMYFYTNEIWLNLLFFLYFCKIALRFLMASVKYGPLDMGLKYYEEELEKTDKSNYCKKLNMKLELIPLPIEKLMYSAKIYKFRPVISILSKIIMKRARKTIVNGEKRNIYTNKKPIFPLDERIWVPIMSFSINKYPKFLISYFRFIKEK